MVADERQFKGLAPAIFSGAFVFGIVMSSLGTLLPALTVQIGFQKGDAGTLFLLMNLGMLIGSLAFGPLGDRFGFRTILLASVLLVGGAFFELSLAESYRAVVAALIVLGLGGGALNGGTNTLLSDISPERRESALNMLGICFGVGALFMPFLSGTLLIAIGLRLLLAVLVALTLLPLALFALASFPAAKQREGFSRRDLRGVLGNPLLYLIGMLLFFQSGNEFTVGGWLSTYFGEQHGMSVQGAAYGLAVYWAALMAGRLLAARIGDRVAGTLVVTFGAVLAGLASAGLVVAGGRAAAVTLASLIGLGFSAIFPTTLAQAGRAFPGLSGTAFSVIFVMALSGGMTAPWVAGTIAETAGVGAAFWLTASSSAAIVVLQLVIAARLRGRGQ